MSSVITFVIPLLVLKASTCHLLQPCEPNIMLFETFALVLNWKEHLRTWNHTQYRTGVKVWRSTRTMGCVGDC